MLTLCLAGSHGANNTLPVSAGTYNLYFIHRAPRAAPGAREQCSTLYDKRRQLDLAICCRLTRLMSSVVCKAGLVHDPKVTDAQVADRLPTGARPSGIRASCHPARGDQSGVTLPLNMGPRMSSIWPPGRTRPEGPGVPSPCIGEVMARQAVHYIPLRLGTSRAIQAWNGDS